MHNSTTFHPIHASEDGIFNSATGKQINLKAPTSDMIDIKDISGALAKICRFGGQTSTFYSVAQHSILVAAMAPPDLRKAALMHDAAEAYLGDVIKPLKNILGWQYEAIELEFNYAISARFHIDIAGQYAAIKALDRQVLEFEHEALQKGNFAPLLNALTAHGLLHGGNWAWEPKVAQVCFMAAYNEYFEN